MKYSRALDDLLEAVRTLSAEEQAQLRRALDSEEGKEAEAAFARRMMEEGVLEKPRAPAAEGVSFQEDVSFQPVPVRGKPVSAVIIEERR